MRRIAYYVVMIALSLLGLWAVASRLDQGMRVTALTSYVSWGLWVSAYIYFIGLSAGSFLLSTMIYVFGMHQLEKVGRLALLTALFSLGAGLLFIWIDLGHLERFWEIFTQPHFTSLMAIESWLYLIYMALILGELWLLMRDDLAVLAGRSGRWRGLYRALALSYHPPTDPDSQRRVQERARRWVTALGIVGIPTAIGVHGGTGAIFAVAIARPYWNSGLFPVVFLVSALASGAALVTFLYAAFGPKDAPSLQVVRSVARLAVLFIGLDLILLLSEGLVGLYGGIPANVEVFTAILSGPYGFVFWLGQLGLAAVIPIVAVAVGATRAPAPRLVSRAVQPARPRLGRVVEPAGPARVAWTSAVRGLRWSTVTAGALVATAVAVDGLALTSGSGSALAAAPIAVSPSLGGVGYWAVQLALVSGVVILLAQRWGSPRLWLGVAGASTVVGIMAVRLTIVIPGFVVPVLEHLEYAYQDSRLRYEYFPSGLEWASTVGLIALGIVVFTALCEVLPIYGARESAR